MKHAGGIYTLLVAALIGTLFLTLILAVVSAEMGGAAADNLWKAFFGCLAYLAGLLTAKAV
jgi:hypothetical protein